MTRLGGNESSAATGVDGNQNDDSTTFAGAAYVFSRSGGWTQRAYVKASNTDMWDQFGATLALSDDGATLSVASLQESSSATGVGGDQTDNSASNAGAVYVLDVQP